MQSVFALCDYVTPNETETEILTGLPVTNVDEAKVAAARLLEMGVKTAIITLGAQGALYHSRTEIGSGAALQCRPGGRDDRGRGRVQWRICRGDCQRHGAARGRALRFGGGAGFR